MYILTIPNWGPIKSQFLQWAKVEAQGGSATLADRGTMKGQEGEPSNVVA